MNEVKELHYIIRDQIGQLGDPVAVGSGADVYRCDFAGQPVAIRQPRITSAAALQRFYSQVELQHRITVGARARVPVQEKEGLASVPVGLLPLLAVCEAPPFYCTVTPWYAGGSLFDALHGSTGSATWSLIQRLEWALQLAVGLRNLHELGIVHRDVKPANVLLDGDRVALADFELAISLEALSSQNNGAKLPSNTKSTNALVLFDRKTATEMNAGPSAGRLAHMVGTTVYLAPEILSAERSGWQFSYESDVYAFGITLNEIVTGCVPYVDRRLSEPELHTVLETRFNELQLRTAIVTEHLRPSLDVNILQEAYGAQLGELIERCWDPDPRKRPTMTLVVSQLTAILDKLKEQLDADQMDGFVTRSESQSLVSEERFCSRHEEAVGDSRIPTPTEKRHGYGNSSAAPEAFKEPAALQSFYFPESSSRMTPLIQRLIAWFAQHRCRKSAVEAMAPAGFRQRPSRRTASVGLQWQLQAEAFAVSGCRGPDRMEDCHLVACPLWGSPDWPRYLSTQHDSTHISLLGVFDGHGSDAVANFAATMLPQAIRELLGSCTKLCMEQLLRDALCTVDVCWMQWCFQSGETVLTEQGLVGSTALVAALHDSSLYFANVGDSRAVLFEEQANNTLNPVFVTQDQNCSSSPSEIERLRLRGASLVPTSDGSLRVEGLVLVTRAIGDVALKSYLTGEPELYVYPLQPDRSYVLILASDGLWDVMNVHDVAGFIHSTVKVPGMLARRLVTEALQRQSQDNITAVVGLLSREAVPNNANSFATQEG
jgi:serine/threonine protein phosphatase PrpC/serine/threonine protein kinase